MTLYYCVEENIGPQPREWWEQYYQENISKAPADSGWSCFDDWWEDMRFQGLINVKDEKRMKIFRIKTKTKTFTVNAKDKASAVKLVKMKLGDRKVKDGWTLVAENVQSREEAKQILTTMGYDIYNIGYGVSLTTNESNGRIYFNERNNEAFAEYDTNTKELLLRDKNPIKSKDKKVKDTDEYIYKLSSYISFIHDKAEQLKEYVKGVERFKDNASDEIKDTLDTLINKVNKACEDVIDAEQDAQDKINK